jgi:AcrR family transcriptional regulator
VTSGTPSDDAVAAPSEVEQRVLDAVLACSARWAFARLTIDDIATESGVSRATIYRLFPGGKEVLFEALRVRELDAFFTELRSEVAGSNTIDELMVRSVVTATRCLRADDHLAAMLASEPGDTLGQLTVDGLPRIVRMASMTLLPLAAPFLAADDARRVIDLLARLTISYFLAPSDDIDLADEAAARRFITPVLAAVAASTIDSPDYLRSNQ